MAPDASLDFALSVQNGTHDPIQYTFWFRTPIVVPPHPAVVHSTLAGAIVDGNESGVSLQPFDEPNVMTTYVANDIPSPIDLGIGLGGEFIEPWNGGTPLFYGPFESADTPVPDPGSWAYLGTRVGFELSGHDSAVLAGGTSYESAANPVPEPATIGLFGLGLLGLGLVKRRRK